MNKHSKSIGKDFPCLWADNQTEEHTCRRRNETNKRKTEINKEKMTQKKLEWKKKLRHIEKINKGSKRERDRDRGERELANHEKKENQKECTMLGILCRRI